MRGARGGVVAGSRGRTAKIFREKEGDNKRNDDRRGPKGRENEEMGVFIAPGATVSNNAERI